MNQDDFLFSHIELRTERCDSLFMRRLLAGGGYGLHQAIWRLLPCDPEARRDFLYHRIDGAGVKFYVVSARELVDDTGLWRIRSKPYAPQIEAGESPEAALGAFEFVETGPANSNIKAAKFDLHISLLPGVDRTARARLADVRFRVQESIEELLRRAHGADFED
ncbi:MAG TPA: type I-E CRISPR-associated protein Cas6/Cse3/CasE, partial [Plasticicumulans sp.]|nr:type I-E CRISPR-associated protein Cas6/Cse3/CasE [Plasticicumulans sp.]